nr:UxaA family hydrolase [Clostridium puniceum]
MLLDEADINPENVIILQEQKGMEAMIDALMNMTDKKLAKLNERRRETLPLSDLCIGMQLLLLVILYVVYASLHLVLHFKYL